jgi:RNA polymerase sigma-70 factor (ECF subfamily)
MIDDKTLNQWFCREVLPLERSLTHFIRRNLRAGADVEDVRQEIYVRLLAGARKELPMNAGAFLHTVARNHLINVAQHARIVSVEFVAELERSRYMPDLFETDRQLDARDELRRALSALDRLPPRCREVVQLRKIEGLTRAEAAERMGVGIDTIEKQLTNGLRAIADFMLGGSGRIRRPGKATARDDAADAADEDRR